MSCEKVCRQLVLFAYGELSFEEEEAVEQHLAQCESCRMELKRWQAMLEAVDEVEFPLPVGMLAENRQELKRRIQAEAAQDSTRRGRRLWRSWFSIVLLDGWLKPVGAMALIALGFLAARLMGPESAGRLAEVQLEPAAARVRSIETGRAGQVQLMVEETRQRVLRGYLDDEVIRRLLIAAAKDPTDPGLRAESIGLLNSRGALPEVREVLLAALQYDSNPGVRLKALEGLRPYVSDPATRRALSHVLLFDDNPGVRTQAIDLMVQKKSPEVAGVLQEVLRREDNNYVRFVTEKALRDMRASLETF